MFDQKFDMFLKRQETLLEGISPSLPLILMTWELALLKRDSVVKPIVNSEPTPLHLNGHHQNESATSQPRGSETPLLTKNNEDSKTSLQLIFSPKGDIITFLWAFEYSLPLEISPRQKVSALLQRISQEPLSLVYRNFQTTPNFSYQDLSDFLIKEYAQPDMQDWTRE
ncbi:hypothetical protein DSO57_1009507 [Entomophthora muscae]|uniref:Uncharacterized protein n=1 Tax=Entomophthora muscae TaxID=34485 RepID=A0ACC2UTF1_9FUNG|nr:hypothetical protein DSO57_1009507 [Entomophthora muscae]